MIYDVGERVVYQLDARRFPDAADCTFTGVIVARAEPVWRYDRLHLWQEQVDWYRVRDLDDDTEVALFPRDVLRKA